jgi:transposase
MVRMEIVTGRERRRRWSYEKKLQTPPGGGDERAQRCGRCPRHDVVPQQIYICRRQMLGKARVVAGVHGAPPRFLPVGKRSPDPLLPSLI